MPALHSNIASEPHRNGRTRQRATKVKNTVRVLAAVDGSERGNGVVDYLATLAKSGGPIEVIVLNVQPLSESVRLRGYGSFKQDEVRDRLVNDLGKPVVDGVGRRLRKAGITVTTQVAIGDPVETILRFAAAERCDLIVVGHPYPGPLRQWIARHAGISFGSVATNLVQLAGVPVVVAKCPVPGSLDQPPPVIRRAPTLYDLIISRMGPDEGSPRSR
jgi:nucleotide-binding universal stress UspA family protein